MNEPLYLPLPEARQTLAEFFESEDMTEQEKDATWFNMMS